MASYNAPLQSYSGLASLLNSTKTASVVFLGIPLEHGIRRFQMAQPLSTPAIKSVDADVVGNISSRHPGGRPRKLNADRFLRICALVERGITNTQACKAEDVDYGGFRAHVRRKPWWAKRFQQADAIRDEYLRDFHLANVTKHSKECWAASAWILERPWPHLFALHYTQHRPADAAEGHPIGDAILAERLAEYGRLMVEMVEENAAKAIDIPVVTEATA
jgi:hypothetical protein